MKIDWLPSSGALLFFYDAEDQPWGFDPKDRGSCAILHVADLDAPLTASDSPSVDEYLPHRSLTFRRVDTRPSYQRDVIRSLSLTDQEFNSYLELLEAPFRGLPKHQVAGLPSPIQGDHMALECQLASNGQYCGDETGYNGPRAKSLEPGAKDWRLVLQLDTDDDLGVMWGDCGTIYFWAQEAEARSGRFANPWLILQCS